MALIKTPANQASPNYDGNQYPYYHFTSAGGEIYSVRQVSPADGPGNPVLEIISGGQQGESRVRLTQQNAADLGTVISNFGSTGTLS